MTISDRAREVAGFDLRTKRESAIKGGPEMLRQQHPALTNNRIRGAIMAKPVPSVIPDDVKARFWAKVDVREPYECWPWQGALHSGYGSFGMFGRNMSAQRASFWLCVRRPQPGLHIDHMCRNRACVNPAHLREVTSAVNTLENSVSIPALNKAKTHCKRGHPLSGENLWIKKIDGARICATCQRKANREAMKAKYWRDKTILQEQSNG